MAATNTPNLRIMHYFRAATALISGLLPQMKENWFHSGFIDAYDWVMQRNVIGMGLFADGGVLAFKPYAASAKLIK